MSAHPLALADALNHHRHGRRIVVGRDAAGLTVVSPDGGRRVHVQWAELDVPGRWAAAEAAEVPADPSAPAIPPAEPLAHPEDPAPGRPDRGAGSSTGRRITAIEVRATGGDVDADGLKGQMFDQRFTGADLLVGPNGAGKTTRGPLAVTGLLEGLAMVPTDPRRPWVGGLPRSTTIRATVQTEAGTVVLERDLSAGRGRAVEQAAQAVRDAVGIPPTAWDLGDFAAGTGGDRAKILDAVARAGGRLRQWTAVKARERVEQIMLGRLPDGVEADLWIQGWEECCRLYSGATDGATLLQSGLVWATEDQVRHNAEQRALKGTAEELGASAPADPGGDPAADLAARARLSRVLDGARDHEQERSRAMAALARHTAEGGRLSAALKAAEAEGGRLAQPGQPVSPALQERVARAEADWASPVPEADRSHLATLRSAWEHARTLADAASEPVRGLRAEQTAAETAHGTATADVRAAAEVVAGTQSAVGTLAAMSSGDAACVHCGCVDPLGITSRLDEARSAHAAAIALNTEAEAAWTASAEQCRVATSALEAAVQHEQRLRDAAGRAEAVWAAAEESAADHGRRTTQARRQALDSARGDLTVAIGAHRQAESQRLDALAGARRRWQDTRAALREWEATAPPAVPTEPDGDALATARAALADVEARIARRSAVQTHVRLVQDALERYERAKIVWDASRALVAAIRIARDELADAAYRPIHDTARAILSRATGLPRPYFRGPDDYGAEVDGRGEVPYAGLSESEQRITAAALVASLASVAGNPCRLVLLDGLEVVQRDHRVALLSALVEARESGVVDQVIATMATAPGEDVAELRGIAGLTVHQVAMETRSRQAPAPQAAEIATTTPEPVASGDGCPF